MPKKNDTVIHTPLTMLFIIPILIVELKLWGLFASVVVEAVVVVSIRSVFSVCLLVGFAYFLEVFPECCITF